MDSISASSNFFCKRGEFLFYAAERLDEARTWDRLPSLRRKTWGCCRSFERSNRPRQRGKGKLWFSFLLFVLFRLNGVLRFVLRQNETKKRIRRFRAETKHLNKLLNYVFLFLNDSALTFFAPWLKNWFWSSFYSSWNFKRAFGPLRVWLLPLKAVNYDRISKFGGTRFSQQHLPPSSRRRRRPCFFQILVWFEWVRSWVRTFCWICVSEGPTATKFALAESELYWPKIWRE